MKKNRSGGSEITIDESSHKSVRTLFQKMRDAILALGMGVILAQIVIWAFRFGSIVMFFYKGNIVYPIVFLVYLAGCAILGWRDGERFIETLNMKAGGWFNWIDWRYWR